MSSRTGSVHVATTRRTYKDKVYETHLLRRSYREGGKVKTETVGNLSHLPPHIIELVRRSLKGEDFVPSGGFDVVGSRGHGHVAMLLGLVRELGIDRMLLARGGRRRDIVVALIVGRLLAPGSKLASVRTWRDTTLLEELRLGDVTTDEVYEAMDWLLTRQDAVQRSLVKTHLPAGSLVLYDLSSSYFTGRHCPLAKHGYSRDHRRDLPQITYGVVTDHEGRPIMVEVFDGNRKDSTTLLDQVDALRKRYKLRRMVLVGDRGMITNVQIAALETYPNINWITALTNPQVAGLRDEGVLQLGLFDERNLASLESAELPGQRLIACRNAALAAERARTRETLLARTEARLQKIQNAVSSGRLKGVANIAERLGRAWKSDKMRKHFDTEIGERSFMYRRRASSIAAEAELDGLYVIRTSLPRSDEWDDAAVVRAYKGLAQVERVFRSMKTTQLLVRPIFHRKPDRVRAHVFLCMLAAHVAVELERRLARFLYVDEGLAEARATRDPVAAAEASPEGRRKKAEHTTADDQPAHSMKTLLRSMGFLTRVTFRLAGGQATFDKDAVPTAWQAAVLEAARTAPA